MQVIYNQTNNLCASSTNGTIRISQVLFTEAELDQYLTYTVSWSNNIPNSKISNDASTASFLPNGSYTFRIISLSSNATSDLYTVNITSPPEFKIINVIDNGYSCDNNGSIIVEVSGGQPPYVFFANNRIIESTSTRIQFDDLDSNLYTIRVTDSNDCADVWNKNIDIKLSSFIFDNLVILPPEILDGPVSMSFDITGDGPFSLFFHNDEDASKDFVIDLLNTEYISNIDLINKKYSYSIINKIYPGVYTLTIKTFFGCSKSENLSISNIFPISVSVTANPNTIERSVAISLTEPRFDTVLIPYKHILENTPLWQNIKNFNLKDEILIKIDNVTYHYFIVRYLADKYCLDDNKIEILKLGNLPEDWYYYFYVAPSINLSTDDVLSSKFSIVSASGEEFPLTLGLSEEGDLDSFNASLIRGSFLLSETNNLGSFINGGNVYVSLEEPTDADNYDFKLRNTKNYRLTNIYSAGTPYVAINFLEQFNVLNHTITIGQSACNTSREDYDYMLNIRAFLKAFNNFSNYNSIYIYNLDSIIYNGSINIFINGNDTIRIDNTLVENTYSIEYYYFNKLSDKLQVFVQNNNAIKDTTSIQNIEGGYVIIRIKDINNNIPKILNFNGLTVNYDNHFTQAKQIIQLINNSIVESFQYGDIIVYMPYRDEETIDTPSVIPSAAPLVVDLEAVTFNPSPQNTENTITIKQTQDLSNTSSLIVRIFPKNAKCVLYGPYNYILNFDQDINLVNILPGTYTILGDYAYLNSNQLYQNENKILIEKNTNQNISIIFQSYFNDIFIRDHI